MVHPEKCNGCGNCFAVCEKSGDPIILKDCNGHEIHFIHPKDPKEEDLILN